MRVFCSQVVQCVRTVHRNVPLRLLELLLAVETKTHQPLPLCVCFGSCVQEKPSAFLATFLCRNSTAVKSPGPTRSKIFTLNTSRISCSRSFALSSGRPKMKSFAPSSDVHASLAAAGPLSTIPQMLEQLGEPTILSVLSSRLCCPRCPDPFLSRLGAPMFPFMLT